MNIAYDQIRLKFEQWTYKAFKVVAGFSDDNPKGKSIKLKIIEFDRNH